MRTASLIPVAVLLAAACQPAQPELTEGQRSAIAAEIDSLTVEWWDAWTTFDWDRGLSFIADDPEMVWTGAVQTVYSKAEMLDIWPAAMAGLARQDLEFTNARTVVLSADIVWTLREGNYVLTDTAGAFAGEGQFNETAVWVKRAGEWKVLLGHDDDTTVPEEAAGLEEAAAPEEAAG